MVGDIFTARNEVAAMYCFYTCVSFCSQLGGGSLSGRPPRQRPPQTDCPCTENLPDPPGQRPPSGQRPSRQRPTPLNRDPPHNNERAVRILLECIFVYDFYQTCFFALYRTQFFLYFRSLVNNQGSHCVWKNKRVSSPGKYSILYFI